MFTWKALNEHSSSPTIGVQPRYDRRPVWPLRINHTSAWKTCRQQVVAPLQDVSVHVEEPPVVRSLLSY
jgi:hypothetical protein